MKKYLIFVVGIIIGIIGTSYAAYKLRASEVSFDKNNTGLNSDDVQGAIDEITTDILSYGDATSADISNGKTAIVKGKKIIGTNSVEPKLLAYGSAGATYRATFDAEKGYDTEYFTGNIVGATASLTFLKNCSGFISTGLSFSGTWEIDTGIAGAIYADKVYKFNAKKGDVVTVSAGAHGSFKIIGI